MNNDISSTLLDSLVLLLVGMTVVFVFLSLLIFAIHGIRRFCERWPEDKGGELSLAASHLQGVSGSNVSGNSLSGSEGLAKEGIPPEIVAAISAAVHQYRK